MNHFSHDNSFCAESEATIQALHIGLTLKHEETTFEGDAMFVVLALQGMQQFEDWKAKKSIEDSKKILASKYHWYIKFVPGNGNACAHHLAK